MNWGKINHRPIFLKRINWCIRYVFLPLYPLVFGGLVVWTKFVERTSLFFDVFTGQEDQKGKNLSDYNKDPATIWLWLSLLVWLLFYIYSEFIKNAEDEIKFHQMMSKNPKPEVADRAKEYFEDLNTQLRELHKWEFQFRKFTFIDPQKELLEEKIIVTGKIIRKIASEFFGIKAEKMSAKFMFFIDNIKEPSLVEAMLEKAVADKSALYKRDEKQALLGVLHLSNVLSTFLEEKKDTSNWLIPIYQRDLRVYNSLSPYDDKTIPGAPTAFFDNNSLISDTKAQSAYENLDKATQDEIVIFFKKTCPEIKSILSFRVPTNQDDCIAVFNLEASKTNTFGVPEYLLDSFEIIIAPFLVAIHRYLRYYQYYHQTNLKYSLNIEHIEPTMLSYTASID